jgi:ankyrin repeat protein
MLTQTGEGRLRVRQRLFVVIAGLAVGSSALAVELIDAARRNDAAAVSGELQRGADANSRAADGTTALHWAVYNDDADLVARLIEAGADVNAVNKFGSTPLSEAAVVGNAAVVEQLVEAGAEVDALGKDGQTAHQRVAGGGGTAGRGGFCRAAQRR